MWVVASSCCMPCTVGAANSPPGDSPYSIKLRNSPHVVHTPACHIASMAMNTKTFQKIRLGVLAASTVLFPVTFYYLSPVISIGAGAAGIVSGSLLVFLLQFLTGMILGRSFCSWLCPGGGIQDQVGRSRTKRVTVARVAWMKYAVWGIWLVALFFFFRRAGGIQDVQFAFGTEMGLSTTSVQALIAYSIVCLAFFLLSLIFGRRSGCHTLCWMAPFMVIGRKLGFALRLPSLHLATRPESCVSCGRCNAVCPMSLDVQRLVQRGYITDNNCILCGSCMDTCRKETIGWAWRRRA